jgi:transposase
MSGNLFNMINIFITAYILSCFKEVALFFLSRTQVNVRARKLPKRGRKPFFKKAVFDERFRTIERVFAWEDKFRRLLLRFERLSQVHYAFKSLAYTLINLRHYCSA